MSPKGVNHYELVSLLYADSLNKEARFPSPTGVNHYEYKVIELIKAKEKQFPSPTGVKYYEYKMGYLIMTKSANNVSVPNRG